MEDHEDKDRERRHPHLPLIPIMVVAFMLILGCGTACFIAYRCGKRRGTA